MRTLVALAMVVVGCLVMVRGGWAPAWALGAVVIAWGLDLIASRRPRRPATRRADGTRRGSWPRH